MYSLISKLQSIDSGKLGKEEENRINFMDSLGLVWGMIKEASRQWGRGDEVGKGDVLMDS